MGAAKLGFDSFERFLASVISDGGDSLIDVDNDEDKWVNFLIDLDTACICEKPSVIREGQLHSEFLLFSSEISQKLSASNA